MGKNTSSAQLAKEVGVVVSLATEVTDARRSICREREPGAFAVAVGGYGMLAMLCLAGLGLCPHG